jgi:hypothetical protein
MKPSTLLVAAVAIFVSTVAAAPAAEPLQPRQEVGCGGWCGGGYGSWICYDGTQCDGCGCT